MADPHWDEYFARAARRLGALTEHQLAEIRHLQATGRAARPMSQVAFENAYLDTDEVFSVLREADRIRAQEAGPRRSGVWPWIALSLTASVALLAGFVTGLVLSPQARPPAEPAPSPAASGDAPARKGRGQPSLELGRRQLDEAARDQFRISTDAHRIDETLRSAIEHLSVACALEPESPEAHLLRGRARFLLGDLDRAEPDFSRSIELAPDSGEAWYHRGLVRLERSLEWSGLSRDPDVSDPSPQWRRLAAEDFQKAAERGLKGAPATIAEAAVAWHSGGTDAAYAKCATSLWETSTQEELHRFRGEILAAKGELPAAATALSRAIEIRAHYPEALLARGLVRSKLGRNGEALEDFTACIDRHRFPERALFNRGQAYHALGRYNSALADWRRCLDLASPRSDRIKELMKDAEAKTKF